MRSTSVYAYQGYTVDVYYLPEPGGQYSSIFTLRQGAPLPERWLQKATAYRERRSSAVVCKTIGEAHEAAAKRAKKWIDKHPVQSI